MNGERNAGNVHLDSGNLLENSWQCSPFSIPGNAREDSGECSRRFRGMLLKILKFPGNVQEDSGES